MTLLCKEKVRYRMKNTSKGKVRLAFCKDRVIETKSMKTGKVHTQKEFRRDRGL